MGVRNAHYAMHWTARIHVGEQNIVLGSASAYSFRTKCARTRELSP